MNLKLDCRHFRGEKPCRFGCGCDGCTHYEPMGKRILIVKLDAIGDVARTTPLLQPLREKYHPCHITWLVAPAAEEMLRGNPMIDLLLPYTLESLESLRIQKFDLVLSLDKTPRATAVGTWAQAKEKLGFGLSEFGTIYPLDAKAEYAFQLGLDDDLKFKKNTRTYQDVIFEVVGIPYEHQEYCITLDQADRDHANRFLSLMATSAKDTVIGLNLGGGSAFAHKMWDHRTAERFIVELINEIDCRVLLLGGRREARTIDEIVQTRLPHVTNAGTDNTIRQFQAIISRCDVVVTGDSLGMHLAIAEKRPTIVLFGPTCPQEIELYGRGEKIVSPVACAPCYRSHCDRDESCMQAIDPKEVVEAVKRWLPKASS